MNVGAGPASSGVSRHALLTALASAGGFGVWQNDHPRAGSEMVPSGSTARTSNATVLPGGASAGVPRTASRRGPIKSDAGEPRSGLQPTAPAASASTAAAPAIIREGMVIRTPASPPARPAWANP